MSLFSCDFEAMVIMIDFNNDVKCNILLYVMHIYYPMFTFSLSVQKSHPLELSLKINGRKNKYKAVIPYKLNISDVCVASYKISPTGFKP